MKKIVIFFKILLLLLFIRVILIVSTSEIPVKYATFILPKKVPFEELHLGEIEVLCQFTQVTGPQWRIIGYNRKLFNDHIGRDYEYIEVEGKSPLNELSEELTLYAPGDSIFIIRGRLTKAYYPPTEQEEKILIAESWDILYPIRRNPGDTILRYFPPRFYLTPKDFRDTDR